MIGPSRRAALVGVGLCLLAVCGTFASDGLIASGWMREYSRAIMVVVSSSWFVATLAAGLSAWCASSFASSDAFPNGRALPNRLRLFIASTAFGCLCAVVGLVLATLAACAVVWTQTGDLLYPHMLPQLIRALAAVIAAALIGALLGLLWPKLAAPVVAAGVVLALGMLRVAGFSYLLAPRTGTVTLVDFRTAWPPLALLVLGLALLACAALIAALLGTSNSQRTWFATTAIVVLVLALLPLQASAQASPLRTSVVQIASCSDAAAKPMVCVSYDSGFDASAAQRDLAALSAPLARLGVGIPGRFVQGGGAALAGQLPLIETAQSARTTRIPAQDLMNALARPAMCPQYRSEVPPATALTAIAIVRAWLAVQTGSSVEGLTAEQATYLRSQAASEWIRQTYPRLRECNFDGVLLPTAMSLP